MGREVLLLALQFEKTLVNVLIMRLKEQTAVSRHHPFVRRGKQLRMKGQPPSPGNSLDIEYLPFIFTLDSPK
jgi:hypothetical protein